MGPSRIATSSEPAATGAATDVNHWQHRDEPAVDAASYHRWCGDRLLQLMAEPIARPPAPDDAHAVAARAASTPSTALPFGDQIQASFGAHDVSHVQAHVGGDAADACGSLGASAFASGSHVAFARAPDLHTAAHEAAHVVQQARGISLYGGVGAAGDAHERQADAVADAVVAGRSAEALLSSDAPAGAARPALQYKGGLDERRARVQGERHVTPEQERAAADRFTRELDEQRARPGADRIARELNDLATRVKGWTDDGTCLEHEDDFDFELDALKERALAAWARAALQTLLADPIATHVEYGLELVTFGAQLTGWAARRDCVAHVREIETTLHRLGDRAACLKRERALATRFSEALAQLRMHPNAHDEPLASGIENFADYLTEVIARESCLTYEPTLKDWLANLRADAARLYERSLGERFQDDLRKLRLDPIALENFRDRLDNVEPKVNQAIEDKTCTEHEEDLDDEVSGIREDTEAITNQQIDVELEQAKIDRDEVTEEERDEVGDCLRARAKLRLEHAKPARSPKIVGRRKTAVAECESTLAATLKRIARRIHDDVPLERLPFGQVLSRLGRLDDKLPTGYTLRLVDTYPYTFYRDQDSVKSTEGFGGEYQLRFKNAPVQSRWVLHVHRGLKGGLTDGGSSLKPSNDTHGHDRAPLTNQQVIGVFKIAQTDKTRTDE